MHLSVDELRGKVEEFRESGLNTQQIADELSLSHTTVQWLSASDYEVDEKPLDVKVGWRSIAVKGERIETVSYIFCDIIEEMVGDDVDKVWGRDELCASDDAIFVASGVCSGYLPGVEFLAQDRVAVHSEILHVKDGERRVKNLNELEYINNNIWANVWLSNRIIVIDPQSGIVIAFLDLSKIVREINSSSSSDVLNGIALDSNEKHIWITGKRWPWRFKIETSKAIPTEMKNALK